MATITKRYTFEAAHRLPGHRGKCATEHGHSYILEVVINGPIKNKPGDSDDGFIMDFGDVSAVVKPIIEEFLDHKNLNLTVSIPRTTAEYIACWLFGKIREEIYNLTSIRLWETATGFVVITLPDYLSFRTLYGNWVGGSRP